MLGIFYHNRRIELTIYGDLFDAAVCVGDMTLHRSQGFNGTRAERITGSSPVNPIDLHVAPVCKFKRNNLNPRMAILLTMVVWQSVPKKVSG